jgi:hypothetical protein
MGNQTTIWVFTGEIALDGGEIALGGFSTLLRFRIAGARRGVGGGAWRSAEAQCRGAGQKRGAEARGRGEGQKRGAEVGRKWSIAPRFAQAVNEWLAELAMHKPCSMKSRRAPSYVAPPYRDPSYVAPSYISPSHISHVIST